MKYKYWTYHKEFVILISAGEKMAEANDTVTMIYQNLIYAGCNRQTTEKCMSMARKGSYTEMLPILSQHRIYLLNTVHFGQKQIDCIDYLIYKIHKEHI